MRRAKLTIVFTVGVSALPAATTFAQAPITSAPVAIVSSGVVALPPPLGVTVAPPSFHGVGVAAPPFHGVAVQPPPFHGVVAQPPPYYGVIAQPSPYFGVVAQPPVVDPLR
jgi:hypothetical protein